MSELTGLMPPTERDQTGKERYEDLDLSDRLMLLARWTRQTLHHLEDGDADRAVHRFEDVMWEAEEVWKDLQEAARE